MDTDVGIPPSSSSTLSSVTLPNVDVKKVLGFLVTGGADQSERLGVDEEIGPWSRVQSAIQYEGFTAREKKDIITRGAPWDERTTVGSFACSFLPFPFLTLSLARSFLQFRQSTHTRAIRRIIVDRANSPVPMPSIKRWLHAQLSLIVR